MKNGKHSTFKGGKMGSIGWLALIPRVYYL